MAMEIAVRKGAALQPEEHPYNFHYSIPEETCLLIIGTAPPPRFSHRRPKDIGPRDVDFYYGSSDNQLWSILEDLYGEKLYWPSRENPSREDSREAMCSFLRTHEMWMRDADVPTKRRKREKP